MLNEKFPANIHFFMTYSGISMQVSFWLLTSLLPQTRVFFTLKTNRYTCQVISLIMLIATNKCNSLKEYWLKLYCSISTWWHKPVQRMGSERETGRKNKQAWYMPLKCSRKPLQHYHPQWKYKTCYQTAWRNTNKQQNMTITAAM